MEINEQDFTDLKQRNTEQTAALDAMKGAVDKLLDEVNTLKTKPAAVASATPAPQVLPPNTPVQPAAQPQDEELSSEQAVDKLLNMWESEKKEREGLSQKIDKLFVDKEVTSLQATMAQAKAQYPSVEPKDLLLILEADPTKNVMDIAKTLHESYTEKHNKLKTEIEAEVKERLLKEQQGGLSVPQSPGSAPTPNPTANFNKTEEDLWATALNQSKAGLK